MEREMIYEVREMTDGVGDRDAFAYVLPEQVLKANQFGLNELEWTVRQLQGSGGVLLMVTDLAKVRTVTEMIREALGVHERMDKLVEELAELRRRIQEEMTAVKSELGLLQTLRNDWW